MRDDLVRDLLLRIGTLTEAEAADISRRQQDGDDRSFGLLAIDLGLVDDDTIIEYLELAQSA